MHLHWPPALCLRQELLQGLSGAAVCWQCSLQLGEAAALKPSTAGTAPHTLPASFPLLCLLPRRWFITYFGNFAGCAIFVGLIYVTELYEGKEWYDAGLPLSVAAGGITTLCNDTSLGQQ